MSRAADSGYGNAQGDRESGIALLLVIWAMALLAALAANVTLEVRTGLEVTRSLMDTSRSRTLADSSVWGALALLLDDKTFAAVRLDGTPFKVGTVGEMVSVAIEDERAKFDINNAGEAPLRKLFQAAGMDQGTAEALARGLMAHRATAEKAAGRRVAAFGSLDELRLVPGFTMERFERIAPFITVHSDDWRINPVTARPEVLAALPGVDDQMVQRYLALRNELAADPVALRLASPPAISGYAVWGEPRVITIRGTARIESGAVFSRHAVVDLDPEGRQPFQILEWALRRVP